MGVEPTRGSLMPRNGFEVREAHLDSAAPYPSNLTGYARHPASTTEEIQAAR